MNLVLTLHSDPDEVWKRLDRSARNQIRKAEKSDLTVTVGGVDAVDEFYAVHAERMRELGSPVHAKAFFEAIVDTFADRARVMLVRKGNVPVGGLVALATDDVLTVPWASCLTEFLPYCPNMLLYWETIRAACREGFTRFDFGRSTRGSGTYRFKRQWGTEEEPLFWYTIPVAPPDHQRRFDVDHSLARVWRRLPLGITSRLGPRVRKYLTR